MKSEVSFRTDSENKVLLKKGVLELGITMSEYMDLLLMESLGVSTKKIKADNAKVAFLRVSFQLRRAKYEIAGLKKQLISKGTKNKRGTVKKGK
jgi:hypothetical protein